ncbi:MAG: BTAD domain-containing putative transcriptional regulator [Candidatus Nanopelagicales bacterium]
MTIELLGPTRVSGTDRALSPRDRVVLSTLCVAPGESVPAEVIADALWGEVAPKTWTKVVQGSVARLRKTLGATAIITEDTGYRLAVPGSDLDTVEFERLVARGRELMVVHEPARAAAHFGRALSLWRGAPFTELDGWDPARAEAVRLTDVRRSVEEELVQARLDMGLAAQGAADAQALVAREPFRERRWGLLALALYRTGRQREALDVLRRARATFAEELGIDPGPELVALETRMLQQDPELLDVREHVAASSATCPYRGLRAFDVGDADFFHGRDDLVADALDRLVEQPLLVVVGASGAGKSSLVRAGVVPALVRAGGAHRVSVTMPGSDPLAALAAASAATAPDGLLVVDQLEELFAQGGDVPGRFLDRLADLVDGGRRVVVTLRADHLGGLAASPRFARAAERALLLITPMSEEQLARVIVEPAQQVGLVLEPGLVDLLLRDVVDEPGALPLLSHALAETWEHREGVVLTVDGYRATGGIRGAVAQSAERLYGSLDADDQETLRSVLRRLVLTPVEGEPVAASVPLRVAGATPDAERILDLLVRARLVTATDGSAALAHESLVRAWPRLRDQLAEDVDGQRILSHLQTAADGWLVQGRPEDELYRGARLGAALDWQQRAHPALSPTEEAFLAASAAREEAEQARLADQLAQQGRRNRQLRTALGGVAALLVVALVSGGLAVVNARRAESAVLDGDARRLAAQSYAADDGPTAQLLAAAAYRLRDTVDTRSALLAALQRDDAVLYRVPLASRGSWVGASADGSTVLVMDNQSRVSAFAPATRALQPLYRAPVDEMSAMSPDGRWLLGCGTAQTVTSEGPKQAVLLDAVTGEVARVLPTLLPDGDGWATCGAFSADGRYLVVADASGDTAVGAAVYDMRDLGAAPRRWTPPSGISALAVGTTLFAVRTSVGGVTTVRIGDLRRVSEVVRADLACGSACPVAISSNDRHVAVTQAGHHVPVQLAAAHLTETPSAAEGLASEITLLSYSPDNRLASAGADGALLVQQAPVDPGGLPVTLIRSPGSGATVASVVWVGQRQQSRLYSVGGGGQLVAWNLGTVPRAVSLEGAAPTQLDFARGVGGRIVGLTRDGSEIYDLDMAARQGRWSGVPFPPEQGDQNAWSADGTRVVLTSYDGSTRTWAYHVVDADTGAVVWSTTRRESDDQARHHADRPAWAGISDDGRRIVVPRSPDRLSVVDVASGTEVRQIVLDPTFVASEGVWFTPLRLGDDGSVLLQARTPAATDVPLTEGARYPWRDDAPRQLVSVDADGHLLGRAVLASTMGVVHAALSPDGTRVAVSAYDGTVQVFDARTLAPKAPAVLAQDGWVQSVSWSPDSSMLLTSGTDGVLALWDGTTLNRIGPATLLGGTGRNGTTAWFTPDGGIGGIVQGLGPASGPTWFSMPGQPERWLAEVCGLAGRDMTAEEWAQYVGDRPRQPVCPQS